MIHTNEWIDPDNFVDGEVIIPDAPSRAKTIHKYLQSRMLFIESALQKLSLTGQLATLTAAQLKAHLTNGGERPPGQPTTVTEYWQQVIDQNTYPFRRFKIKTEQTDKHSLPLDELRSMRDYPCEPHLAYYRDIFLLIFYLSGINAVELFHLREIRNGRIEFLSAKTRLPYAIKVEPVGVAILRIIDSLLIIPHC